MTEVRETKTFKAWIRSLRDQRARDRINSRIRRMELGNPGDAKPVGGGVSELRIDYGPGYRLCFVQHGEALVILLCGGDKQTQDLVIRKAIEMVREIRTQET